MVREARKARKAYLNFNVLCLDLYHTGENENFHLGEERGITFEAWVC